MKYLQSLTDYLISNGIEVEKLEAWAEDGELITSSHNQEDGYELKYTCCFEMSDVSIKPHFLFALISAWLQRYCPDRDTYGLPNPVFFTQKLSNTKFDIGVKIDFIEQFKYQASATGNWRIKEQMMELVSDFQQPFDVKNASELIIFDGHTQDKGLENA